MDCRSQTPVCPRLSLPDGGRAIRGVGCPHGGGDPPRIFAPGRGDLSGLILYPANRRHSSTYSRACTSHQSSSAPPPPAPPNSPPRLPLPRGVLRHPVEHQPPPAFPVLVGIKGEVEGPDQG